MVTKPITLELAKVIWGEGCRIGYNNIIGYPKETSQKCSHLLFKDVIFGDNICICNSTVIYEGTRIYSNTYIDDCTRIGYDCIIGENVRITHNAYLCDRIIVGNDCIISGFICDAARIGDNSTVMGNIVHEYTSPNKEWWDGEEQSPIIGNNVVIGYGATIIGGITIEDNVYIGAGAIVSKSVPSKSIVINSNQIIRMENWKGNKLKNFIMNLK